MKALILLILAGSLCACAQTFSPPPTPQLIASLPDTLTCRRAVVIKAGDERSGIDAERRWLDAYYPGHGPYNQALQIEGSRSYDVLAFRRANGHDASVCFDITSFFGHY